MKLIVSIDDSKLTPEQAKQLRQMIQGCGKS